MCISSLLKSTWSGNDISSEDLIKVFGKQILKAIGKTTILSFKSWLQNNKRCSDVNLKPIIFPLQTPIDIGKINIYLF